MSEAGFIKTECSYCDGGIEFPIDGIGTDIPCPHCGKIITLSQPAISTDASLSAYVIPKTAGKISRLFILLFCTIGLAFVGCGGLWSSHWLTVHKYKVEAYPLGDTNYGMLAREPYKIEEWFFNFENGFFNLTCMAVAGLGGFALVLSLVFGIRTIESAMAINSLQKILIPIFCIAFLIILLILIILGAWEFSGADRML